MECKHCGSQMYERKSKQASNSKGYIFVQSVMQSYMSGLMEM